MDHAPGGAAATIHGLAEELMAMILVTAEKTTTVGLLSPPETLRRSQLGAHKLRLQVTAPRQLPPSSDGGTSDNPLRRATRPSRLVTKCKWTHD